LNYFKELFRFDLDRIGIASIFLLIIMIFFIAFYTVGFTEKEKFVTATKMGLSYWFSEHKKSNELNLSYYPNLLFKYEFFPLILSTISFPIFLKRLVNGKALKTEILIAYWLFTSIILYQVLGHKMPWLILHIVTPLVFFGSMYTCELWQNKVYKIAILLLAAVTLLASVNISYIDYNNAERELTSEQISPSAIVLYKDLTNKIESGDQIAICVLNKDYHPIPWYLRKYMPNIYLVPELALEKIPRYIDWVVVSEEIFERKKFILEEQAFKPFGKYKRKKNSFLILAGRT